MESPPPPLPLPYYISQNSKKRVFPGGSSTCMEEADVVEIPPPVDRRSKLKSPKLKEKEVIFPEIIDVDMDEESADTILVDREIDTKGKGKEVFGKFPLGPRTGINHGSGNTMQSSEKNYISGSQYLINEDDFGIDFCYGENHYADMYHDDQLYDDQYDIIQAHFDSLDIPPGVEVSVPWFTGHQENKMKSAIANSSYHSSSPIDLDGVGFPPHSDSSSSIWPMEFEQSSSNKSTLGALKVNGQPKKWGPSSSWLFEDPAHVRKMSAVARSSINLSSKTPKGSLNFSPNMEPLNSHNHSANSWRSTTKRNPQVAYSVSGSDSLNRFSNTMKHPDIGPLNGIASRSQTKPHDVQHGPVTRKHLGNGASTGLASSIQKKLNDAQPAGLSHKTFWDMPKNTVQHSFTGPPYPSSGFVNQTGPQTFFPYNMAFDPWVMDPFSQKSAATPESSSGFSGKEKYGDPSEFFKNFDLFKRFDTVQDSTDHYYFKNGSSVKQPSKNWAKKIQEEWRILENHLPDSIFVRVYESRIDILRACIIGAEGTPYHDGLFFFDVFFPSNYPNVPPHVHYHSGGLRINPNLYNCGKVCLSLLNTWSGSHKEKWIPGVSTILQVLVSIQGLILNAKPFFNEPGYANMHGTPRGESSSLQYNETTFILSLKTMVYNIRRPPKYFEDLVAGHFYKRAHDILVACKAYIDGAQVGCLVKGGVQDVDEGDKSCSQHFKNTLAGFIKTLVDTFAEIGVKDCDEFLSLAQKTNRMVSAAPLTTYYNS
ncbi:hypothetical protein ACH5RR_037665 [Cinchona calisaya]|uniref:E2 ubiquitin-conjugating enzyme n=1 Tax=Cinchona calisaya TaxID=153742 RepID=A0ABD2Y960_9GENT